MIHGAKFSLSGQMNSRKETDTIVVLRILFYGPNDRFHLAAVSLFFKKKKKKSMKMRYNNLLFLNSKGVNAFRF